MANNNDDEGFNFDDIEATEEQPAASAVDTTDVICFLISKFCYFAKYFHQFRHMIISEWNCINDVYW